MEKDYAEEVRGLREMKLDDAKRVRVSGQHAKQYGYTFAVGHIGKIVGERTIDDVKQNKVFTGTRIWFVPEVDCIEIEEKKR